MQTDRLILSVATDHLPEELGKTGFGSRDQGHIIDRLQASGLWLGPRAILEETSAFRQIIPYVVLRVGDQLIHYTRTPAGGEARLHGRISIGLGGHIDFSDVVRSGEGVDLQATLDAAAVREVEEEVGAVDCVDRRWIGALIDNESPVGQVHLGVVALWTLTSVPTGAIEDAIGEVGVQSIKALANQAERLETWSGLTLDALDKLTGLDVATSVG